MNEAPSKSDMINEVIFEMGDDLTSDQRMRLKNIMLIKFSGFVPVASETLPSTELHNNDYILKRYMIDNITAGNEKSTVEQYLLAIRNFFATMRTTWDTATSEQVNEYLVLYEYNRNIKPAYKATLRSYICNFFTWLYEKGYVNTNITINVVRVKVPHRKIDRLTDEEVACCRSVSNRSPREHALIELLLSAGPRVSEVRALNIEHINFEKKEISIYSEKTNEWRTAFLSEDCKVALKNYLGDRTSGPVFIGERGRGRMCNTSLERIAKGVAVNANCHVSATIHLYRKTFASITYRKVRDVLLVSKLLGHKKTDTTIRYYLADDIDAIMDTMKRVS